MAKKQNALTQPETAADLERASSTFNSAVLRYWRDVVKDRNVFNLIQSFERASNRTIRVILQRSENLFRPPKLLRTFLGFAVTCFTTTTGRPYDNHGRP